MPYTSFEPCTVHVEGQSKRGVRARCMHCGKKEEILANGSRGRGADDDVIERDITHKFEKIGWKIGKNLHSNVCPEHREKIMEKKIIPSDKVVLMSSAAIPAPRGPTRDEKRIIFQKVDEMYVGETVGYSKGWSDERVAKDLNVPIAWVSAIREENFGPDIDEVSVAIMKEAKSLIEEVRETVRSLNARADEIEKAIADFQRKK